MSSSHCSNEDARLRAVEHCGLFDHPPEAEFDQITELASQVFDAPIALISLIDADRQWFVSHHGTELREIPRDMAFCARTILGTGPLVVPDTRLDPRFAGHPLVVGAPRVRFYAGAPLTTHDGANVGALAVLDTVPREFGFAETATLLRLATIAMTAIEARSAERRLRQAIAVHEETARTLHLVQARYQRIVEHTPGMVYQFIRRATGRTEFLFVSEACRSLLGLEPETLLKDASRYFQLVHPADESARQAAMARAVETL